MNEEKLLEQIKLLKKTLLKKQKIKNYLSKKGLGWWESFKPLKLKRCEDKMQILEKDLLPLGEQIGNELKKHISFYENLLEKTVYLFDKQKETLREDFSKYEKFKYIVINVKDYGITITSIDEYGETVTLSQFLFKGFGMEDLNKFELIYALGVVLFKDVTPKIKNLINQDSKFKNYTKSFNYSWNLNDRFFQFSGFHIRFNLSFTKIKTIKKWDEVLFK